MKPASVAPRSRAASRPCREAARCRRASRPPPPCREAGPAHRRLRHGLGGEAAGQRRAEQRVVLVEVLQQGRQPRRGLHRRPGDQEAAAAWPRRTSGPWRPPRAPRPCDAPSGARPRGSASRRWRHRRPAAPLSSTSCASKCERARSGVATAGAMRASPAWPARGRPAAPGAGRRCRRACRARLAERERAAQAVVVRIADRRGDRQAVHAAAADHHQLPSLRRARRPRGRRTATAAASERARSRRRASPRRKVQEGAVIGVGTPGS